MTEILTVVHFNKVKEDSSTDFISVSFMYIYKQLWNFIIFNGEYYPHCVKENIKSILRKIAMAADHCLMYVGVAIGPGKTQS